MERRFRFEAKSVGLSMTFGRVAMGSVNPALRWRFTIGRGQGGPAMSYMLSKQELTRLLRGIQDELYEVATGVDRETHPATRDDAGTAEQHGTDREEPIQPV